MRKDTIYLTAGIVLTVLFWLCKVPLFEAGYYSQGFSNDMYNLGFYDTVAMIVLALGWVCAGVYYYVVNSVKFDRWWHWLATLAVTALLSFVMVLSLLNHDFSNAGLSYSSETTSFVTITTIYTAVIYVIASFSIRWWSTNCRHTPFPQ